MYVATQPREVLTKVCCAGFSGSGFNGAIGMGWYGSTACCSTLLLLAANAVVDTARKDKRSWAVTRPAEEQPGLSFLRRENMTFAGKKTVSSRELRRPYNYEIIEERKGDDQVACFEL